MNRFILLLLLIFMFAPEFAYATTYGVQVEFMANGVHDRVGDLLAGGRVHSYDAGLMKLKSLYLDRALTTEAANPVILDGEGKANVFASGYYKFIVKDSAGTTIRVMDNFAYTDISTVFTGLYNTAAAALTFGYDVARKVAITTTIAGATTAIADGTVALKTLAPDSAAQFSLIGLSLQTVTAWLNAAGDFVIGLNAGGFVLSGSGLHAVLKNGSYTNSFTTLSNGDLQWKTQDASAGTTYFVLGSGGSITLSGTGANASLSPCMELDLSHVSNEVRLPLLSFNNNTHFLPDGHWEVVSGYNNLWTRLGSSTLGGQVQMAGILEAKGTEAGVSHLLGTIENELFVPNCDVVLPCLGKTASIWRGAVFYITPEGLCYFSWQDGTEVVAVGDFLFLDGLSYPLR